jgi:hypothetical protein
LIDTGLLVDVGLLIDIGKVSFQLPLDILSGNGMVNHKIDGSQDGFASIELRFINNFSLDSKVLSLVIEPELVK